ncbi:MAG: CocE/NonD family hydrolase [Ramlibacter sp.]
METTLTPPRIRRWQPAGAAALLVAAAAAFAQAPELDAALNETVETITKPGVFAIGLETTVYRPDGPGPFPVAIINHGKANGDPRFQSRYRPAPAARYFLQRGYAVVVPMRQGFSRSGGSYIGGGCNVESNGRVQAEDVKAVVDHLATLSWVDRERMLVLGQSHGGWTTLAFGAQSNLRVKGLVNFAGGLRQELCPNWKEALAGGAASYGRSTTVPSLWFYGDNDSYFDPPTFHAMFDRYTAGGAPARLVAFGSFGSDAHSLFGSPAGTRIWQPEMSRFLREIGMPSDVQPAFARYGVGTAMALPPATGFAALEDEARLPHVQESGRAGYKIYLGRPPPRAFAIAANGAWGWADGGDDPLRRALEFCNRRGGGQCRLYSVDDQVVWETR